MTVAFELNGQPFLALNGGPQYTFSEAVRRRNRTTGRPLLYFR
jgi:predicted 3-demethylubiquinone-9 3-methyltransferase (glyoxalase superfamily)